MLGKRLHLLAAFAGGCLSTAFVVIVWRSDTGSTPPVARTSGTAPLAAAPALSAMTASPEPEDPALPQPAPHADPPPATDEPAAEPGRSVADVLAHLEVAYRDAQAPAAAVNVPADAPPTASPPAAAPAAPSPPPAAAPPAAAPPATTPPVVVLVSTPQAPAPAPAAVPAPAPVVPSEPSADARDGHESDVSRDAYLASLYAAEVYRREQLVTLQQYLELLAQSSNGRITRGAATPAGAAPRRSPRFSFPLTNPDNPWGFELPPTVLVK